MAFPFKSGGDFYTQELLRVRLQNFDGDLPEYGTGSIYHNTSTGLNTSDRIRYRGKTKWYSVANMDDIQRLEDLIAELDFASSGDFSALIKRVQSVEGNFTDGKANDSQKLGGQLPSFYATQSAFSALQEKVSAFLDGDVDSDAVLENLKEIQAFLDNYDGATSLADMFDAVDVKLADRYTKAESNARYLQLMGGTMNLPALGSFKINCLYAGGKSSYIEYHNNGEQLGRLGFRDVNTPVFMTTGGTERVLLHENNYSDLITKINGDLSIGGSVSANFFRMANNLIAMSYVNIGTGRLYIGYGTTTENQAETYIWGKKLGVVNPSGQTMFDIDENGNVHVTGNLIVEGEVSAKGKGQEGGENTGGGFQLFDETNSWESYEASMQDWILTAYHGKLFNDRISLLENKATKVEVSNLLSSGTKIATIKVDNNSYDVLAPFADAYTKTESDAKYLKLSGGTISGGLTIKKESGESTLILGTNGSVAYNPTNDATTLYNGGSGFPALSVKAGLGHPVFRYNYKDYTLIHSGNANKADVPWTASNILFPTGTSATWNIHSTNAYKGITVLNAIQEKPEGAPDHYAVGLSVSGYYGFTLASLGGGDVLLYRRINNSDWKTIAFTDSDITGTANNANQLGGHDASVYPTFENAATCIGFNLRTNYQALGQGDGHIEFYDGGWYNSMWGKVTAVNGFVGNLSGNASSATKLETARTIWGQSFDGTGDVDGNIKLDKAIGINLNDTWTDNSGNTHPWYGLDFTHIESWTTLSSYFGLALKTGSGSIYLNSSGNVTIGASDLALTNYKLYVNGNSYYNGVIATNNVFRLYGKTNVSPDTYLDNITYSGLNIRSSSTSYMLIGSNVGIGTTDPNYKLHVEGDGYFSSNLYIGGHIVSKLSDFYMFYDSSKVFLQAGSTGVFLGEGTQDTTYLSLHGKYIRMVTNGVEKMRITEDGTVRIDGSLTAGATTLSSLIVNNAATFNGGVDIPMGQSLKIGDATIKYEGGALKVDKSIHSEGEVSAKGKGTEGAGGTTEGGGNSMKAAFDIPRGYTSYNCEHDFHTREVTVCIYEDSGDYQQVLADVYLDDEDNVRIQFGSPTDVPHRAIIMA